MSRTHQETASGWTVARLYRPPGTIAENDSRADPAPTLVPPATCVIETHFGIHGKGTLTEFLAVRLAISLGIGLLIGVERERRKGTGAGRAPAGIRTFALASLAGGLSLAFGGEWVLVATALVIGALTAVGYGRSRGRDPGLTTEIALVTTVLLGALAVREPGLASGLAVGVVILLASRSGLHRFVRRVLTEQELHDALVFAAAALVILPLTPDRPIGPLGVLNPAHALAPRGHLHGDLRRRLRRPARARPGDRPGGVGLLLGLRLELGDGRRDGRPGAREPGVAAGAVAGAVLSTVATVLQMMALLAATSRPTLSAMRWPLLFAGVAAALYALALRDPRREEPDRQRRERAGRSAFRWRSSSPRSSRWRRWGPQAIHLWLGDRGLILAAAAAGLGDAHAAAIAVGFARRRRQDRAGRGRASDSRRPHDEHADQGRAGGRVAGPPLRRADPPGAHCRRRRGLARSRCSSERGTQRGRTVRTGQGAVATTRDATLPTTKSRDTRCARAFRARPRRRGARAPRGGWPRAARPRAAGAAPGLPPDAPAPSRARSLFSASERMKASISRYMRGRAPPPTRRGAGGIT